jgi:hypothetical protein
MASIVISPENNMHTIVGLAGGSMDQATYAIDSLHVQGVSQEDLDAAFSTYMGDLETHLLEPLRQGAKERMSRNADIYISQSYPPYRREFFLALSAEARGDGLTNRVNYINQLLTWAKTIVSYTITQGNTLDLETNPDTIISFSPDFSSFDVTNPNITIQAALEILD